MKVVNEVVESKETRQQRMQKEFDVKLKEFAEKDHKSEYERFTPMGDKVIISLFKFQPSSELQSELGQSEILVQSQLDGKFKPKTVALSEKIFPIAKVIKRGCNVTNELIKEGQLYTVPYEEVTGEQWNPDFLHLVQTFSGKSGNQGKLVNIPEDMPQKLPKLYIDWVRYKFSMPDRLQDETDTDKLVYIVPSLKLETMYAG